MPLKIDCAEVHAPNPPQAVGLNDLPMELFKTAMKVSVILPAYNEEGIIGEAIKRVDEVLRETGFNYEIIVVDDGSNDATRSRALKYARNNSHVKVVSHPNNMGKGAAVRTGFSNSTGDLIAFIDADLEINPKQLQVYFRALENADIAIGSKWHPKSNVKTTFTRRLLSRSFYALARLLVGIRVSDTQVGLKAFKREALENILRVQLVKRYAFDVELLAVASLLNLKIVELPVNLSLQSRFSIREVWRMLMELLGITYRLRVTKWYQRCLKSI